MASHAGDQVVSISAKSNNVIANDAPLLHAYAR